MVEFAKYYISTCIETTQMPIHICIVLHILAQQYPKIFNSVDVLECNAICAILAITRLYNHTHRFTAITQYIVLKAIIGADVD